MDWKGTWNNNVEESWCWGAEVMSCLRQKMCCHEQINWDWQMHWISSPTSKHHILKEGIPMGFIAESYVLSWPDKPRLAYMHLSKHHMNTYFKAPMMMNKTMMMKMCCHEKTPKHHMNTWKEVEGKAASRFVVGLFPSTNLTTWRLNQLRLAYLSIYQPNTTWSLEGANDDEDAHDISIMVKWSVCLSQKSPQLSFTLSLGTWPRPFTV